MKNIFKVFLFIFIFFTMFSCGSRFWEKTINFFILRSLNQYFDINSEQKNFLKEKIEYNLNSYKYQGIPQHIAFLKGMQDRTEKGINREDVPWFYIEMTRQTEMIADQFSNVFIDFLMTLEPEQIDHFEQKLAEQNKEIEKRRQKSDEKDPEDQTEDIIESFEEWLGPLSDTQKKEILNLVKQMPDDTEESDAERLENQQKFIRILRNEPRDRGEIEIFLSDVISRNQSEDESINLVSDFVIKIDRMITPKQRNHFIEKLDVWVERFEAMTSD